MESRIVYVSFWKASCCPLISGSYEALSISLDKKCLQETYARDKVDNSVDICWLKSKYKASETILS